MQRDSLARCPYLVHKVLDVLLAEALSGVDDPVHVRLHQLGHDVHVLKVREGAGYNQVHRTQDLRVAMGGEGGMGKRWSARVVHAPASKSDRQRSHASVRFRGAGG